MARTKVITPSEAEVLRAIKARLEWMGLVMFRRNVGAMKDSYGHVVQFASAGQSDLYGWEAATGRHWEVEVKRRGNRPTPAQLDWLVSCTENGAVAFWADNPDTASAVARAVLAGGRIAWRDDGTFDVETW